MSQNYLLLQYNFDTRKSEGLLDQNCSSNEAHDAASELCRILADHYNTSWSYTATGRAANFRIEGQPIGYKVLSIN